MKKAVIFFILFITFFYTNAQTARFLRKINWEHPKTISYYYNLDQKNLNKTTYLYFNNACYYDHQTMLPYYYELIKVNSNNIKLIITDIKYEQLSNNELNTIENKTKIPTKVFFRHEINLKRKQPYAQLDLLPLRKNPATGQFEKIISFNIEIKELPEKESKIKTFSKSFVSESVLKTGNWTKIQLSKSGVYKISYSELVDLGFSNPGNIKIYGNSSGMLPISNSEPCQDDLAQNHIYFNNGSDGVFNAGDYILFYAQGPDQCQYDESDSTYYHIKNIYSNYNYYFLTTDIGSLETISTINTPAESATETNAEFRDCIHYEEDNLNLLESGQLWFGEHFDLTESFDFDFDIPDLINSSPIKLKAGLVARSSTTSSFTIKLGSQTITTTDIGSVNMSSYKSAYANNTIAKGSFSSSTDDFTINITYDKPTAYSEGWLDYITLNAQRELRINDDQLIFRYYNHNTTSQIVEFQIKNTNSSTKIWNITNPTQPLNINKTDISANSISIKVEIIPGLNEFIAFNDNSYLNTESIGNIENQNLHGINHRDMIIVSNPEFLSQAEEIAGIHEELDGLNIEIVTPEQIFNEFSSGAPDVTAIRNFIRMIYERATATDTIKYLLFIGDGSYDHKSILANNIEINYVPTYQSYSSLNPTTSFVADDFFGLLDPTDNVENSNSGLVDIGIGRLPVKSTQEAQQMVEKIKTYINPANKGDWLNTICFVGDDEDSNIHMRDADKLAEYVDSNYKHFFINKIYLDAFPQESSANNESYPEVNRLINDEINNGLLIFNYTGHGGESGLAHERIISIENINSWINYNKLPVFMTATCEFSRFDNHKYTSAGELVLLNPNGGSIALFSTTRLVYSNPNYILNSQFYNYVFEKDINGNRYAFGDIIRLAKNAAGSDDNKRNFTLLGDPALKVPFPEFSIITDSVNNNNAITYTDTIKALSKVTIHGHIEDNNKDIITGYNGIVYPLVLDKKQTITTLANDGGSTMDFELQNNILYKGKASVANGKFQYSFIVPKDISYNLANGKISYYSLSSDSDAKGYFDNFIIGGSNPDAETDNFGPTINLYMNDENFVSGGVTNENPKLYAILNDSSGINTVGNGIGHDITAILDNNSSSPILLNDYYESDIDDYQNGKIEYLFSELENGDHQLNFKVWDVYNNSNEEELEFTVAESEELAIKNLFNYPNPFTEQTAFYFDHNRPNEDLEILIQIFTVSGKLIKTINTIINSNSFRSEPINWDGLDDFGDKIGRGIYIYQVKVRTTNGETIKKIEKLVILK